MVTTPGDTDILVVGAGPTGLLLANLLGGMGVRTTIIERNHTTVQEPRAVSIDDESMRALQAAGLARDIEKITAKGYGSLYRGPSGGIFAEVKPYVKDYGFDKRNAFEQPVFEARMREALARHSSVRMHFGTTLVDLTQDETGVVAHLTDEHGSGTIRANYVVACDGGRSHTRGLLGISLEGSTFKEPWLIVDLKSTKNTCFHTEVFCDPERSVISLPGPDGIRRYEFRLNPDETAEQAETEDFARKLLDSVGPDKDEPIRRLKVYTFHARIAEKWRDRRVFLAGDAAHLTPPFAGQGMNSGLRDAHNLAWKLDEALRLDNPEKMLASYEVERKPHAWEMIELALKMGKVMMPSNALAGFAIRTGFSLLSLYGPAKNYMLQMKYKPRPRFRDGLLVADGAPTSETVVGRMIPQPLVTTTERAEVLLDEILPDKPVILVYDAAPHLKVSQETQKALENAGAALIGLTPEWSNPQSGSFPVVRDRSRFFSQAPYSDQSGKALLLRRDRYVAASSPIASVESLISVIERLHRPNPNTTAIAEDAQEKRLIA